MTKEIEDKKLDLYLRWNGWEKVGDLWKHENYKPCSIQNARLLQLRRHTLNLTYLLENLKDADLSGADDIVGLLLMGLVSKQFEEFFKGKEVQASIVKKVSELVQTKEFSEGLEPFKEALRGWLKEDVNENGSNRPG